MSFFDVLFIKDDDILQHKGADALQYLIFQRYIIYFMFLLTCLCMAIILPINANGDFYGNLINLLIFHYLLIFELFFQMTLNHLGKQQLLTLQILLFFGHMHC